MGEARPPLAVEETGRIAGNPRPISRATPFEELPEFLTPEECRLYLGIGRALVYDLLRRGEISSVRFGRLIRIPKTALKAASAESRPDGTVPTLRRR
jgi:excisionase family DNA binding protein